MNKALGKVGYGLLFCAVLPALLVGWARLSAHAITWPVGGASWSWAGAALGTVGMVLIVWAMLDLWYHGKGLPMNAFPPQLHVSRGAYALLRHPIYVGACLICAGCSLHFSSASGTYLVTPVLVLGCWALVQGYEGDAVRQRFGTPDHRVLFSLPPDDDGTAGWRERCVIFLMVFVPWIVLYELLIFIGPDADAWDTFLAFERSSATIPLAEVPYASTYLVVALAPLFMRTHAQLRAFAKDALWAVALGLFLQAVLPLKAEPSPLIDGDGPLLRMIQWERSMDGPAAAFPSFHVLWALIAAWAYRRRWPRASYVLLLLSGMIAWSCWATNAHSLLDVVAAFVLFGVIVRRHRIWSAKQETCQRIANSWKEWHIGPVRVISHSIYAGAGGTIFMLVAAAYGADAWVLLFIALLGLVVAALWGQFVEGSPRLLRPFGFYGSVIGVALGALVADQVFDEPMVWTFTVLALAAPWMQAVGRLRCLVQGCCHGRPAGSDQGIRYTDPHTRVVAISGLGGCAIHNTQLYSMISNVIIGLVLWRLAWSGASMTLIIGLYLIGSGAARFVEEHYRGESQTKVKGGLRLYQWIALVGLLVGIGITCIPSAGFNFVPDMGSAAWSAAAVGGVVAAVAMGVDLPRSNVRFSRLSG